MAKRLTLALTLFLLPFGAFAADAKKLSVHEWGVFRIHDDLDMANASVRSTWDGLPPFVHGHIRGRSVPQHWGALEERDRPILFFHADSPVEVTVRVQFPGGMPGVWWPGTEEPALFGNQKQPPVGDHLLWRLGVKQPPRMWYPKTPAPPEVEKGHWFERLREVKSDEIFASFGPGGRYVEREKFLYYDGLFPQGRWVKIEVSPEKLNLTNRVKHPLYDVTVIDRRADDKVRIGRLALLEPGDRTEIALKEFDSSTLVSTATAALTTQLVASGLFPDEAKSLADLWRKEMFETPGLHLFYRIPSPEYDRLMPLTIEPKPESVVRTGLVFHGHIETDFPERILALVKDLDSPRFTVRDTAKKKLVNLGPAALGQLVKLKKGDLSTEVWKQLETLIKQWNAREAFE